MQRARAFKKDRCENCGATSKLDMHHTDRNESNNDPANLKTLCHSCHTKRHIAEGDGPKRKYIRNHCKICGEPVHGKGLCEKHYYQRRFQMFKNKRGIMPEYQGDEAGDK